MRISDWSSDVCSSDLFTLMNGETRLIGAEALLRWNHPERGTVPPGSFIAIAEETGLIVPIGDWTLREATAAARRWNADPADAPAHVAVNLTFSPFDRPDPFAFIPHTFSDSPPSPEPHLIQPHKHTPTHRTN